MHLQIQLYLHTTGQAAHSHSAVTVCNQAATIWQRGHLAAVCLSCFCRPTRAAPPAAAQIIRTLPYDESELTAPSGHTTLLRQMWVRDVAVQLPLPHLLAGTGPSDSHNAAAPHVGQGPGALALAAAPAQAAQQRHAGGQVRYRELQCHVPGPHSTQQRRVSHLSGL
jgi:7-keto-8-aminopelargonate synthetase-like enzyme